MNFAIFFLALFHSVLLADQEPQTPEYNIYSKTLCMGDTMQLGEKSIKFNKIISDSRCPRQVTCVWAGEVKVLVEFYENGAFMGEKVITGSGTTISEFFSVKNIDIAGMVVTPYPDVIYKISPEEYSLNLKISEKVKAD